MGKNLRRKMFQEQKELERETGLRIAVCSPQNGTWDGIYLTEQFSGNRKFYSAYTNHSNRPPRGSVAAIP